MRRVGHVKITGKTRNAYRILARKPETKRLLRKCRHRWEDNIKWILKRKRMGGHGPDSSASV
jgi:hypothetical protein